MRIKAEGRHFTTKTTKNTKRRAGADLGVLGVLGVLGGSMMGALALAGSALAQAKPPLIHEPVAIAPGFDATMLIVDIPPAGDGPLTTAGQRGHRHPASTYAYVSKGAVINRLGDQPEKRFEAGQSWSETPNQPHYIVNASRTEPAQLVVVQISKSGTARLTEPLPLPAAPK